VLLNEHSLEEIFSWVICNIVSVNFLLSVRGFHSTHARTFEETFEFIFVFWVFILMSSWIPLTQHLQETIHFSVISVFNVLLCSVRLYLTIAYIMCFKWGWISLLQWWHVMLCSVRLILTFMIEKTLYFLLYSHYSTSTQEHCELYFNCVSHRYIEHCWNN